MTQLDARSGGARILAVTSIFLVLVLAVIAGTWLANVVIRAWPGVQTYAIACLLLSISAFVLFLGSLLLAGTALSRFVECGTEHFAEAITAIWPPAVMLSIATLGAIVFGNAMNSNREAPANTISDIGIVFAQSRAHDSIFIPFFPVEGKTGNCDWRSEQFGDAERMTGVGVEKALEDLMKSLSACSSDNNPVVVDIRGFASSSEFRGCAGSMPPPNQDTSISEHMNWRLAEKRRLTVIESVRDVTKRIKVSPGAGRDRWANADVMRKHMQFSDRDTNGAYSKEKGTLTRRAEVVILSKGTCEPH